MKKRITLVALVAAVCAAFLASGCGSVKIASDQDFGQTTVAPLNQNNFHVVRRVSGESTCSKVLGISFTEVSSGYLKSSAITKMYDNAHLMRSQTIVDVNVVKSRRFIFGPIYTQTIVVATGTIIEFDGPAKDVNPSSVRIVE